MINKDSNVFIWHDTSLAGESPEAFESYMLDNYDINVKFIEELTLSNNRVHLLFTINDSYKFDNESHGINPIEDIYLHLGTIYPDRLIKYFSKNSVH